MFPLLLLVRRSLARHALSTAVTAGSVALASGLAMAVSALRDQAYRAFAGSGLGFDAVLGARGSPLQLVLNAVYHLETSPGNIPWRLYDLIRQDDRVRLAVPLAMGDNHEGFRVVGTTEEFFTKFEHVKGRKFKVLPGGRIFNPDRREAVVGYTAALRTGLKVRDRFHPSHSLSGGHAHCDSYLVVGVLAPSGTPHDRAIFIPIEGIFRMDGHELRGGDDVYTAKPGQPVPDEVKEIGAVLLKLTYPPAGSSLDYDFNKMGRSATIAWPVAAVVADLFNKMGWVVRVLGLVAAIVTAVAAGSVLAALYNSMNARRRDLAILRALGARRRTLFSAVVLEAAAIAAMGTLLGMAVYAAILAGASAIVRARTGVGLEGAFLHPIMAYVFLGMTAIGAAAGILPALRAYRTDVAGGLEG